MFNVIRELFSLLMPGQRKRIYVLQFLVILMTFAEIGGVAALGAFMALISDINVINSDNFFGKLYRLTGLHSASGFIIWAGILTLVVLVLGAALSVVTTWRLSLLGENVGVELSDRLYQHYLHQEWLFHAENNSSFLINKIAGEAGRITNTLIAPLLQLNAKLVFAVIMLMTIFLFNPVVAISGLMVFGIAYFILYKAVYRLLAANGKEISEAGALRHKLMSEGFGGVKDILLLGRQKDFVQRYYVSGQKLAKANGENKAIAVIPRYFMEVVAFAAVIFLIVYLVNSYDGDLSKILPILAMYALAGFKLLPAFQAIYAHLASIKSGIPAFEVMRGDLRASYSNKLIQPEKEIASYEPTMSISFKQAVSLHDVAFTYPGKGKRVLSGLSMIIPVNKVIGIVGSSGSGKSTTIDILLGLIKPDAGQLLVDGIPLDASNLRAWQNTLGFVPQSIFLSDGTIAENIAFGLPKAEIDIAQVERAIKLAHLDALVEQLPDGIDTRVGERGVQLSGGQRQRIGIARSLYYDAQVLILDEATSALDGITEKLIMDAIHDFSGKKTIIMIAHRLTTVQACDIIYFMDKGHVVDAGSYDELIERNPIFKKMARHA